MPWVERDGCTQKCEDMGRRLAYVSMPFTLPFILAAWVIDKFSDEETWDGGPLEVLPHNIEGYYNRRWK